MKKTLLFLSAAALVSSAFAATSLQEGTEYYIRNVETGKWMNCGYSWGTKGIVKDQARAFQVVATDGGYALKSSMGFVKPGGEIYLDGPQELNGDAAVYEITAENGAFTIKDKNGYVTIEQNEEGNHVMKTYGDAYDAGIIDDSWESWLGALQSYDFYPISTANYSTDNAKYWEFLTKEEMVAELANATAEKPLDATFLIKAFMLDRNDPENSKAWKLTLNGEAASIGGDNDVVIFPPLNWGWHNANEWGDLENEWAYAGTYGWFNNDNTAGNGTAVVSQAVEGAPAGYYEVYYHVVNQPNTDFTLTVNGVEGEVCEYYNDNNEAVDLWYTSATGVLADRDQVKCVAFTVGEDGKLAIEMSKAYEVGAQNRFAWKSFIIKYLGVESTGVEGIASENVNAPIEYYNLQGVRVANPTNGIYVVKQGDKVTKAVIR